MRIESIDVDFTDIPETKKIKCTNGKWHHFNRVFILEKNHRYSVIVMNIFERFLKSLIGEKNYFNCFIKLKNSKIIKAGSFPPPPPTFNSEKILPMEMWVEVLSHLNNPKDLVAVQLTSRQLDSASEATKLGSLIKTLRQEAKQAVEWITGISQFDYLSLYFDTDGKLQAYHSNDYRSITFGHPPPEIYFRDNDNLFHKTIDTSFFKDEKYTAVNLQRHDGFVDVWQNKNSNSPNYPLVRNALFYFANKFNAGLEKIAKEKKIPKYVLRNPQLFKDYSKIWEYSELAEIPNISRFFSKDETTRKAEIKKFDRSGSFGDVLCD